MNTPLNITVTSTNERMAFSGQAGDFPPIALDYIPPHGDGTGYMPLQLVLISLATCAASAVQALLRRMGRIAPHCTVQAEGIRRDTHPMAFTHITLRFHFTACDATMEDVAKALQLSEQSICPVLSMLKGNVDIATEVTIDAP